MTRFLKNWIDTHDFWWMSFPVNRSQKCPRNLPIRVNTLILEWKRFRRIKFSNKISTTFICTISPKWRDEEMANNKIMLHFIICKQLKFSISDRKNKQKSTAWSRENSSCEVQNQISDQEKVIFIVPSKVKSHWTKLMAIIHSVLVSKWV